MAVQKRIYWLRHIILIAVVAIVLFPIVWVVTTSVRRDNAAFSTKLFSTRSTFQHYKDLLLPPRNLPVLLAEMQNLMNLSQRFSGMSETQLQREFDWMNQEFIRQMDHSLDLMAQASNDLEGILEWTESEKILNYQQFEAKRELEHERLDSFIQQLQQNWAQDEIDLYTYQLMTAYLQASEDRAPILLQEIESIFPELSGLRKAKEIKIEELLSAVDQISGTLRDLMPQVTEEVQEMLAQAIEDTKGLFLQPGFTYSRWNREVNIRILNRAATLLRTMVSEEVFHQFDELREEVKELAQSAENATISYEQTYRQSLDQLQTHYDAYYHQPIQLFEAANRLLNTKVQERNKLEAEIQDLLLQEMAMEEKLDFLQKSLLMNVHAFQQAFLIIESTFSRTDPISDPSFVPRATSFLTTIKNTNQLIDQIQIELLDSDLAQGLETLNSMTVSLVTHEESVMQNLGYSKVRDSISAMNNSILVLFPRLEDLDMAANQIQNNLQKVLEKKEAIPLKDAEIQSMRREVEEKQRIANSRVEIQRWIMLRVESLYLRDGLQQIRDFESLSRYILQIRRHREAYGLGGLQSYREDDWMERSYLLYDLIETMALFERGYNSLEELTRNLQSRMGSFAALSEYYIRLKLSGSPIVISEFNEINSVFSRGFEEISAILNRVGRKVSDLSERDGFGPVQAHLRNQDRLIFDMTQYWYRKPEQQFVRWLFNSIIVALLVALISVAVCSLGAYPFSRMRFKGRKYGLLGLLLIQMFPTATMGIIALYSLLRFLGQLFPPLGLDTLGGLTFVYLGGSIAFNMWLIKGYFDTIPTSMEEAAMIDGSTRLQTFWRIVLPLAIPVLSVVFILGFMGIFNEFLLARIILQSPQNYTYPVGLQTFAYGPYQTDWGLFTAAALLGAIPMVVLFLLMQNYIVSGLTKGAEKG